ncbi:MAG: LysM peptidoglycan-binding domain-containing protein [Planctomycetes bacterium]|nr:LysM peptidoglycan-binding domain-containing protein [Planctomycetota bacterium]
MKKQVEQTNQPRFGVFITMMVGILLFFGIVSRIHDLPGVKSDSNSISDDSQELGDLKKKLEEERRKTIVLFGGSVDNRSTQNDSAEQNPAHEDVIQNPEPEQPQQQEMQPQPERFPRPQPQQQDNRRWHVIKPGDTLWKIATQAYGNGNMYYLIKQANPKLNPAEMKAGDVIIIPDSQSAGLSSHDNHM